jgi:hypothetical protein
MDPSIYYTYWLPSILGLPRILGTSGHHQGSWYDQAVLTSPSVAAEREGFEPSEQVFPTRWFSKPVPSASRPPLHGHVKTSSRGGTYDRNSCALHSLGTDCTAPPCPRSTDRWRCFVPLDCPTPRFNYSIFIASGGGGIRTPGALARRFSRPLPSTTRPLLRTSPEASDPQYRYRFSLVKKESRQTPKKSLRLRPHARCPGGPPGAPGYSSTDTLMRWRITSLSVARSSAGGSA